VDALSTRLLSVGHNANHCNTNNRKQTLHDCVLLLGRGKKRSSSMETIS
jgi:hypothetical protein